MKIIQNIYTYIYMYTGLTSPKPPSICLFLSSLYQSILVKVKTSYMMSLVFR